MLDKLQSDLKNALKNSEKERLNALRNLISKIKSEEIEKGETLSDDECLKVCIKNAKQIKESISQFEKGGRQDLAEKEKEELDIISSYLPEELTDNEIITIIKNIINNVNASGPSDMGKIMGPVMGKVAGRADGKRVQKFVLEELNK